MAVYCGTCKSYHDSAEHARRIHLNTDEDPDGYPTPKQRAEINELAKLLGIPAETYTPQLKTWRGARELIRVMRGRANTLPKATLHNEGSRLLSAPRVAVPMPYRIMSMVIDGQYALRQGESSPWVFFRVTRPPRGKSKDLLIIQTRHGPNLVPRIKYNKTTGEVVYFDNRLVRGVSMVDWMQQLLPYRQQAMIDYATEVGACCICNTELTDPESLHYGIGPECKKYFPGLIEQVAEIKGPYIPEGVQ